MHSLTKILCLFLLTHVVKWGYVDSAVIPEGQQNDQVPDGFNLRIYDPSDRSLGVGKAPQKENPELLEGDIAGIDIAHLIATNQVRKIMPKNGILPARYRWPNAMVPYVIGPNFRQNETDLIFRAFDEFNKTQAIRFYPRRDEKDYIYIQRGEPNTGCWSYVGRIGGGQAVNLQASYNRSGHCLWFDTVVHELNHAVGFYHEQSRSDRDLYVEINKDNIPADKMHNFNTYDSTFVSHYSQPYDYASLMHYEWNAFAINRTVWTIRGKGDQQNATLGNDYGLTPIDVNKIDAMFPLCAKLTSGDNARKQLIFQPNTEFLSIEDGPMRAVTIAQVEEECKLTVCTESGFSGECRGFKPSSAPTTVQGDWISTVRSARCACPNRA